MKSPGILVILTLLVGVLAGCAREDDGRMEYGEEMVNESTAEHEEGDAEGESGTQYALADTAEEIRSGIELSISYDSTREVFSGTITNATDVTIRTVRVEVHLSNGVELGPTPNVDLVAGETKSVELDASNQSNFNTYSIHIEIGSSRS